MKRTIAAVALSAALTGCLGMIGTDRWLAASYGPAVSQAPIASARAGGDEAFWLRTKPADVVPVVGATETSLVVNRTFDVGTKLVISGTDRLNLEIINAVPAPAGSGLVDGEGRPLIVVTARERGKGLRLMRFLVEADRTPTVHEKSL